MNAETGGGLDVARLREVAEAATPGPWTHADANEGTSYNPGWEVTNAAFHNPPPSDEDEPWLAVELHTGIRADAEHIATFDPPTVLALLDALADRDAALARVEALHTGAHQCLGGVWWTDDPDYRGTVASQGPCPTRTALHPAPRETP